METFYKNIISRALSNSDKLNNWEKNFVLNLSAKSDSYTLSDNQKKKLNQINNQVQF